MHAFLHVLGFVHEEQRMDASMHLKGPFLQCAITPWAANGMFLNDLGWLMLQSVNLETL